MKKFYSFFLFISFSALFAQNYISLLNPENRWVVRQLEESEDDDFPYYIKYRLNPENTLTFNDKEYISVQWKWRYSNGWGPSLPWTNWENSGIYISENLEQKKVFVYYDNFQYSNGVRNGEFLLYDFDLEIGDPIPTQGFVNGEIIDFPMYVSAIEYQNVLGHENVKTYLTGNYWLNIYEGMGSSDGLFTLTEFNPQSTLESFYRIPDDYSPLIQDENGWEFSYNQWDFMNGQMNYVDYKARLGNDQITFNDKIYHAIETKSRERTNQTPQTEWSEWKTEFYLSENVNKRKVYVYYPEENSFDHAAGEFLLYDFGLEEGDLMDLSGFIGTNGNTQAVVSSTTSEHIFGMENVRTSHFSPNEFNEYQIYEGIGASTGLISLSFLIDAGWNLTHYGILNSQEIQTLKTQIYPNPFKDKIQIQNSEEIKELQLFDLQGKLMGTSKNSEELNAKLNSINNAVYFLKITYQNNKSETIKLIKNK